MFKFQKLNVWIKAISYVDRLFSIADELPHKYQHSIGEQLRRAALSITNNIAEGSGRRTKKDQDMFFNFSKGSVYETISILTIISKRNLLNKTVLEKQNLYSEAEEICKMLTGLMR
jgi:four helix bundle protein